MISGIIAGFFLPVCDCASIPVFKSLIKKGIPLPAASCFMTASPVINPVVILSTYYAYNGNIRAVLYRCGTGILCSFLIGLTFIIKSPKDFLRNDINTGNYNQQSGTDESVGCTGKCSTECYRNIIFILIRFLAKLSKNSPTSSGSEMNCVSEYKYSKESCK